MISERRMLLIESRLQAIKEIANNACFDVKDYENIADFCDEIYNLVNEEKADILDKIRAEIKEEKEEAYADFERYKVAYLGADPETVEDDLPQDDFRFGMERCLEIINKHIKENKHD